MKIKSKLFLVCFMFIVTVTIFGLTYAILMQNIYFIDYEISESKDIITTALKFNVENFHTQLEIWEYVYDPTPERLFAFNSHYNTSNELLIEWQDIVLNEKESDGEPYHALYEDAVDDMTQITLSLKLLEEDMGTLLVSIEEYVLAVDERAPDEEIKQLDLFVLANANELESNFDKFKLNEQIDLFVSNQENLTNYLKSERNQLLYNYTLILYFLITGIGLAGLVCCYIISKSIITAIKKLKDGSEHLAKGEFFKVEISGKDELTDLTKSFNKMVTTIQKSYNTITENLNHLKIQKSELDDVNKQLYEKNKISEIQSQETFQRFILQKQLSISNAELKSEKKFRVKRDEFASMISHEIKTPILPIMLQCKMLKDPSMLGNLLPEQYDAVIQIELMAKKLNSLTGDIFDAQKLDMNQMKFEKTRFKVSKFFNDIIKTNKILLKEKNILLISCCDDLEIQTDRNRLFQVFSNLIQNAIANVHKNTGKIEISAICKNEYVIFSVKDSGIGIKSDKIPNLFRKFYQIDTSLKRKQTDGTGLGLVICKGIVNGLGGKIWVESEVSKGTTFMFSIPKNESYDYIAGVRNPLMMFDMMEKN